MGKTPWQIQFIWHLTNTNGITIKPNFLERTSKQSQNTISSENTIEYRVQFLTSSQKYEANSPVFKGLSPVNCYKDGTVYKYTYGSATDLKEIITILHEVQPKFKDAFIVQFQKWRSNKIAREVMELKIAFRNEQKTLRAYRNFHKTKKLFSFLPFGGFSKFFRNLRPCCPQYLSG